MGSEAETKSTEPFNAILIEELRRACEDALALRASQRDLPQRVVSVLRRFDAVGLMPVSEEQTDWNLTALVLQTRSPEFWPHLIRAAAALEQDSALEAVTGLTVTGLTVTAEQRAMPLWNAVLAPMFERYARRQPELNWDPALATRLVDEWRASFTLESFAHRTIAPLHNLRAPEEGTVIDENTVIRAMTDEDRNELWSRFSPVVGGPITLDQLNEWTDVIDVKWAMPRKPPFADEIVVEHVRNVVTAVRLHHMGVTGTTVLWTRLDPDDAPAPGLPPGQTLSTPFGDPTFTRPLRTTLGPDNGQLKELVDASANPADYGKG